MKVSHPTSTMGAWVIARCPRVHRSCALPRSHTRYLILPVVSACRFPRFGVLRFEPTSTDQFGGRTTVLRRLLFEFGGDQWPRSSTTSSRGCFRPTTSMDHNARRCERSWHCCSPLVIRTFANRRRDRRNDERRASRPRSVRTRSGPGGEMADAGRLNRPGRKTVRVRVPPRAPCNGLVVPRGHQESCTTTMPRSG